MIGLALVALGVVTVVTGSVLVARSPGYRIGRLLAGARTVSIDDALAAAGHGTTQFVRVHGRISSDEEFPDEQDRPLVYRRKRIEVEGGNRRWLSTANETEGVPFGIESEGSFIAVDSGQLDAGLVVIERRADGVAADLPTDMAASVGADSHARLVVEQVSAVEHAWVAGVPQLVEGRPTISAGHGRPLILTTLDVPDAMRVLGAEGRRALALGVGLFVVGLGLLALGIGAFLLRA